MKLLAWSDEALQAIENSSHDERDLEDLKHQFIVFRKKLNENKKLNEQEIYEQALKLYN